MKKRLWSGIAVLLGLLGCGGSNDPIEAGVIRFSGPFPQPAQVSYVESGEAVQVLAFPGQVMLFLSPQTASGDALGMIGAAGGTVLAQAPSIGYYLVQVPQGQEGIFIAAVEPDSRVLFVKPHPVGRPASGAVILDDPLPSFPGQRSTPHGKLVERIIREAQGEVEAVIDVMDSTRNFVVPALVVDEIVGRATAHGRTPVHFNLSSSGGLGEEYADLVNDRERNASRLSWQIYVMIVLNAVAGLRERGLDNFAVTMSTGNGGQPIGDLIRAIRTGEPALYDGLAGRGIRFREPQRLADALERNVLLVGATHEVYANSNNADQDPDVAYMTDATAPDGHVGTSFAAPRALVVLEKVMERTGATAPEALKAAKQAVAENPYHVLVLEEAVVKAELLLRAELVDVVVTSIRFLPDPKVEDAGVTYTAVIDPAAAGVILAYTVLGSDGYSDRGTLTTDGRGCVAIFVPRSPLADSEDAIVVSVLEQAARAEIRHRWTVRAGGM